MSRPASSPLLLLPLLFLLRVCLSHPRPTPAPAVPRHIQLAVRNDEELNKLMGGVTIASGGVMPHIHAVLVHTGKKNKELASEYPLRACASARERGMDTHTGNSRARRQARAHAALAAERWRSRACTALLTRAYKHPPPPHPPHTLSARLAEKALAAKA